MDEVVLLHAPSQLQARPASLSTILSHNLYNVPVRKYRMAGLHNCSLQINKLIRPSSTVSPLVDVIVCATEVRWFSFFFSFSFCVWVLNTWCSMLVFVVQVHVSSIAVTSVGGGSGRNRQCFFVRCVVCATKRKSFLRTGLSCISSGSDG